MQQELRQLDAVAARMRRPEFWRLTAIGLLTGGILGVLLAAAYWGGAWDMLRWIALGCVVASPVIGIAIASRKKVSPESAARAIDSHYGLKSRALTLWSYSRTGSLDEAHQFVVQEALPHLKRIDPNEVVPVRIPKTVYVGGLLAVLTVVVAFLPRLEFGGTGDTAKSEEEGQMATDGAEMTSLPELPSVPPELAVRSLQAATTDASPQRAPDTSTLPGGAAEVVSRYFEALSQPAPEDSP
jgi:hypothetical protein